MSILKGYIPLREYCRQNEWPRLAQWHHWIYSRSQVAEKCIRKIEGRYLIDVHAFQDYVANATLSKDHSHNNQKE